MDPTTGTEHPTRRSEQESPGELPLTATGVAGELSPDEVSVLQGLKTNGSAFTFHRLQATTRLSTEHLEAALSGLREKGLVTQLNTLIPSYSYRYPGVEV
jgi:hypothetical protein